MYAADRLYLLYVSYKCVLIPDRKQADTFAFDMYKLVWPHIELYIY
jgi:hypothetical protein